MTPLVKKKQVETIKVYIWSVQDMWMFSLLPDEGVSLFYVNAGWHLDRAKEFFCEHKGFPFARCEFIQVEAPEKIRRLRPPPGAKRQLMELEKRELEKPIYSNDAEIKKRGEFIRKMNEEIRSNPNKLRTQQGSVITYEQKARPKRDANDDWKESLKILSKQSNGEDKEGNT